MLNQELMQIVKDSGNMVFFGGAGVSTESGIPDFRSKHGIMKAWNQYGRPPEEIICKPFFDRKPEIFYDYYRKNLLYPDAKPNGAHYALAGLERQGRLKAVVTQNIDGLHQKAGSKNVIELHGSTLRNYCVKCASKYDRNVILESDSIPLCPACGGIIRPDIVLYQEQVAEKGLKQAETLIENVDTLIVGGTSLVVYPAVRLIEHFHGKHLVFINKTPTEYDQKADLVINEPIGQIFEQLMKSMETERQ